MENKDAKKQPKGKNCGKPDWSFIKIFVDRNEPKVSFGEPKFTKYSYVDKKDGRKRTVVRCEVESTLIMPTGIFQDTDANYKAYIEFPPVKPIKTVGKAICDERDADKFSLSLGKRVSRVRAEKKAFQRHACALRARTEKLLRFYHTSIGNFMAKAEKVAKDEIIWEEKKK